MKFAQIPNILTMTRIILVIPIILALLQKQYTATFILFCIASLTDMLDGFVAKKFKWQSYFGSIIDPLADKILLVSIFFTMYLTALIPLWFFIVVLLRDVIIVAGFVGYFVTDTTNKRLTPTSISKINTVAQIILIIVLIISQKYPIIDYINTTVIVITTTITIVSGLDYIWLWLKQFIIKTKK